MFQFADEAIIEVHSGKGGNGCIAFRREKYIPHGGPNGGDGGKGGDVIFVVKRNMRTLSRLRHHRIFKAKNGSDGMKYSIPLTREEVILMENHQYEFLLEREEELAKRLYVKMTEQVYSPKTIVEYERTAYTYPVSDVRVTFDRNIRGSVNPYGIFEKEPFYIPLINPDMGVLEVKYNDFFPSALKPLLESLDGVAESYSKYSMARLSDIFAVSGS